LVSERERDIVDAFWTQGNVASAEAGRARPSVGHVGWGAVIHAETPTGLGGSRLVTYDFYVHIPLANAVLLGNRRPMVKRVFALWTANDRRIGIDRVDVWDGATRRRTITPGSMDPNDLPTRNTVLQPGKNQWEVEPFPIGFGLGLSLHFLTPYSEDGRGFDVTISAAGVDLE
jgi:hypothetical protein